MAGTSFFYLVITFRDYPIKWSRTEKFRFTSFKDSEMKDVWKGYTDKVGRL